MYKNILIITTSRDDNDSFLTFFANDTDIDPEYRDMVIACIENKNYQNDDLWASKYGDCGSERGYIFEGGYKLPMTVEHIVNYLM
jgi:hypothetical protein